MIAVEQGLVTLDQNVRDILPELRDLDLLLGFEDGGIPRKPILKNVTTPISLRWASHLILLHPSNFKRLKCCRQLLSHQSGFAYDQLNADLQEWSKYNKRTEWTMTGSMVSNFSSRMPKSC
jgi:CubicO group peptidase (beta-lactamase class C family)